MSTYVGKELIQICNCEMAFAVTVFSSIIFCSGQII